MSYTPINWQTGDTITAEKMNKMDNGWGVSSTQLFSESVTTETIEGESFAMAIFSYSTPISDESIVVTFNGTNYTVNRNGEEGYYYYGDFGESGPSFANYPFVIESGEEEGGASNAIYTANAGTYTVAVNGASIEVSDNFSNAVNKSVDKSLMPFRITLGETTFNEVATAFNEGRICYAYKLDGRLSIAVMANASTFSVTCITVISTSTIVTEVFAASSADDVLQQ